MKKQWSSSDQQEERPHRSSLASAAAIHARITSMAIAGPSGVSGLSSVSRKHGLTRFSLRRLFGSSFNRKNSSSNRPPPISEPDSHSENSFLAGAATTTLANECKDSMSYKEGFRVVFTGQTSSDSESNSLSSARSDLMRGVSLTEHHRSHPTGLLECPLCLLELPFECFPCLSSCNHRACYDCLQHYLKIEITESRVNISCPHCAEPLHPNDIRMILNDGNLMLKYEEFLLRRVLVVDPDIRWCPAPDCGYAVIASGCASCPKLKCERPHCDTYFCYHCKQEWHPNQTCDAARAQRAHYSPNPRSASVSFSQDSIVQRDDIKLCPCCKALIVKMDDGSCNHMTCSVCGTEFCWLCMKEISDLHYLSPSGCTFWGKKPWSRKKKIMWQLGMLVGAPVGIALIAGIAVPAIIIGIPVWVGRKLHAKYSKHNSNAHKRNLVVTSGIIASILVSPILAGIAVGIGVPILLAYVYGVVPISLCRSGGCGVTTSASGVRIEFDEENEMGIGGSVAADGVSVDTAVSHHGANPSIGEVSFGMSTSLSLGSGCHLERVGVIRESDRESASNTGIAGRSLTGSIASASLTGNTAQKLEIQADVSSNKRFSLSSHSETASVTVSLSERSTNMSLAGDDASTRALAGSILSYKDCISSAAVTPVEVHADAQASPEDVHLRQADETSQQQRDHYGEAHPTYYKIQTSAPSRSWWSSRSSYGTSSEAPRKHDRDIVRHNSLRNGKEVVVVSFIDEPPCYDINDAYLYNNAPGLVEERDESYYYSPSPRDFIECAGEPMEHCTRKISMFESKSLDHLIGYCELCQKVHRPCCPHAHSHHTRVPQCEGDTCNGNCMPLDTVSLKYHANRNKEQETCAKTESRYEPGAKPIRGPNYYYEDEEDPSVRQNGIPYSMHRRSSPAISHLPYIEEPETARRRKTGRTRPHSMPCHPPNSRTDLTSDEIHMNDFQELESL